MHEQIKGQHLKRTVLWGTITWSEMGRQNIQGKKVYSLALAYFLRLALMIFVMILTVHSTLDLPLFVCFSRFTVWLLEPGHLRDYYPIKSFFFFKTRDSLLM